MSELNNLVFKILGEHPFSGRLYGKRSHKHQALMNVINDN